jgi:LysM repeat protein
MVNKKIGVRLFAILLLGVMLMTACTQSYSAAPAATATMIPAGLFVSPLPTGVDAMQLVADFGTQTAEALSGTSATPQAVTPTSGTASPVTDTPTSNGTLITPLSETSTPAMVVTSTPVSGANTVTASTVVVSTIQAGVVPATYTLQQGEFPYCIARRFNVDPDELLSLNGLNPWDSRNLVPGLTLNLPQTGNPFPGPRALIPHPATYTVTGNNDTTIYGVACVYGDIDPATIAQANNLPLSTVLTAGQQLTIP